MSEKTTVPARVGLEGPIIRVEVDSPTDAEEDVAIGKIRAFQDVADSVGSVAEAMTSAFERARPNEAEVEFGVDVTLEAGQLTSLIVKGSGTATLKVRLLWKSDS